MANHHNPQKEMRLQTGSFILSLVLTVIAFIVIAFNIAFAIPIILFLAVIQVFLQLYIFMHLKEPGTGMPRFFIISGASVALITALTFLYLM